MLFQISYDRFLEEIRIESIDETQLKAISETLKNIEESLFKLPIRERIIEREVTKEE